MPIKRKIKIEKFITKIQKENIEKDIEKEYFTKIAEEKPNKLELYKKCYYTEKNRILFLTAEEKKIRNRINSSILYRLHMLDPEKREKKREGNRKSYMKNKAKYLITNKLYKRKKKQQKIIIPFILYLFKIGYKIKKETTIDYSVNSYVGLYKLKYEGK
jgi:hypothetical protein